MFIEHNMPRNDDTLGGNAEASIAIVRGRIAEKDTHFGMWRCFVGCNGGQVRVAYASKNPKMVTYGRFVEELFEWSFGG